MHIRRQLPSTVKYFQPLVDCVTAAIQATTSVFELTELLKKTLPGDQFSVVDPHSRQPYPASFGQWLIARINLSDLNRAKQQATNEIIGRINTIVHETVPVSKVITPWDVQMAILRARYLIDFFETMGNVEVQALVRDAQARPGMLPIKLSAAQSGSINNLSAEEFVVGVWVAQKEITARYASSGTASPVQLSFELMGSDFSADLDEIAQDPRYYDTSRPSSTSVLNLPMWFTTTNLPLGVDYYCKLAGIPTVEVMPAYFNGTDPATYSMEAVIKAASSAVQV